MKEIQFLPKRGQEKDRMNITPELNELIYTLDERKVYIGDGITKGGLYLGKLPKEVDGIWKIKIKEQKKFNWIPFVVIFMFITIATITIFL